MNQKPVWPRTTIFWGAGATAALGMSSTEDQAKIATVLASADSLEERVKRTFCRNQKQVISLLKVLGDDLTSNLFYFSAAELAAGKRLFSGIGSDEDLRTHLVYLRETYDWDALKRIIEITPKCRLPGDTLRDLYNILDMHILSGQGFFVNKDGDKGSYHIPHSRLIPARNCLIMLTNLSFYLAYQRLIEEPHKIEPYKMFSMELARSMQVEGLHSASSGVSLTEREFYLFSYAVVSMNYDPLLLWFIFNAHRELNTNPPNLGVPPQPMRLYNDFGIFMGVRKIDSLNWKVWYPFNETVVQRLNNEKYLSGRRARIGKFYFAHGCSCWRECKNCGKLTVHFGDEWSFDSSSLFPNPLIPDVCSSKPRSKLEEENASSRSDAIQCAHCGALTFCCDTPMIMQSSFKGNHPHYLEDIQRDLKVCIENTQHIVLMGYSLPQDDVIWRSVLAARQSRTSGVLCTVVVGYKGPDKWLRGNELEEYAKNRGKPGVDAINSAIEIFGSDRVRAYTHGIPHVWMRNGNIQESVNKIMNWC